MDPNEQQVIDVLYKQEHERYLLGELLLYPDRLAQCLSLELAHYDFYSKLHATIYKAMCDLAETAQFNTSLDLIQYLTSRHEIERIGGVAFISSLIDQSIGLRDISHLIPPIKMAAQRRRVLSTGQEIQRLALDGFESDSDVLDKASALIGNINHYQPSGFRLLGDVVRDRLKEIEEYQGTDNHLGVLTGFTTIDMHLGGLQPGQFIVLGARPGAGKTAFMLNVALNVAVQGKKVGIFSLEMSQTEIADRAISYVSRLNSRLLRSNSISKEHWNKLIGASNHLETLPIFIDDTPNLKATQLENRAARLKAEYGLDLLMADYIQLLEGSDRNSSLYQEVTKNSRAMKIAAKKLRCPLIALAQLSREVEKRTDHTPMLADLKESGSLEQDADIVTFLYRPELYPNCPIEEKGITKFIIAKQRGGLTPTINLAFDGPTTSFQEIGRY